MKTQKTQLQRRIRVDISEEDWEAVTENFELIDDQYTHRSVNSRLRKASANRENGKKGGRPPTAQKPKEPKKETQNNPPLEREREREIESEEEIESELGKTPTQNFNFSGKQPIETLKKNCAGHTTWLESIGMRNSITMIQVMEWFDAFCLHILASGKIEETESEFKKFCSFWISSEIRQGRKPQIEAPPDNQKVNATDAIQKSLIKKYGPNTESQ